MNRLNCSLAPRCKAAATHVVTFLDELDERTEVTVWHRCGTHLPKPSARVRIEPIDARSATAAPSPPAGSTD